MDDGFLNYSPAVLACLAASLLTARTLRLVWTMASFLKLRDGSFRMRNPLRRLLMWSTDECRSCLGDELARLGGGTYGRVTLHRVKKGAQNESDELQPGKLIALKTFRDASENGHREHEIEIMDILRESPHPNLAFAHITTRTNTNEPIEQCLNSRPPPPSFPPPSEGSAPADTMSVSGIPRNGPEHDSKKLQRWGVKLARILIAA